MVAVAVAVARRHGGHRGRFASAAISRVAFSLPEGNPDGTPRRWRTGRRSRGWCS